MADIAEIYGDVTSNLQNVLIVFLGFLILISVFVFFPYYFLVDTNKIVQSLDFLLNNIDTSLESVKHTFSTHPMYTDLQKNITRNQSQSSNPSLEKIISPKNNIDIMIDKDLLRSTLLNISYMKKNLTTIKSINEQHKLISQKELGIMETQILKLENFTNYAAKAESIKLSEYETFFISLPQKVYPDSVEKKKTELEQQYKNLAEGVTQLEVPIIGSFPFQLNQILLLFPGIIAIGFPFISLQIRRTMILNKEITDKEKHLILSWLDPLQKWPDNTYAILTIIVPAVIFSIFLISIYFLFYINVGFTEQNVLNEKELIFLPEDTRNMYMIINLIFGLSAFASSYYLIFKEWFKT